MVNNIEDSYCSYEVAKLLKEKKFDVPCRGCYSDEDKAIYPFNTGNQLHINSKHPYYSAPSQAIVIEWLRINFGIWIRILATSINKWHWRIQILSALESDERIKGYSGFSDTPQEATEAALLYTLKNLI